MRLAIACVCGFISGYVLAGACGCSPTMTPAQVEEIGGTSTAIAHCQIVGRAANSYSAYDCCMRDAQLHDGPRCVQDAGGKTEFGTYTPPPAPKDAANDG